MDLIARKKQLMMMNNGLFLPPEYMKCDYIETNGYNARIDTGVQGNDETLAFDCDFTIIGRVNYGALFGNHINDSYRCWRFILAGDPRALATMYNRKAGSSPTLYIAPSDESYMGRRANVKMSYGECTITSGSHTYTATTVTDTADPASTRNIAIGSGSPGQSGSNALVVRFWNFKILKNGIMIRNYIPCYRKSDNKAGLYDTINYTFNPSIGSVEFVAGYNE